MYILSEFFQRCERPAFVRAAWKPGNTGQTAPKKCCRGKATKYIFMSFYFFFVTSIRHPQVKVVKFQASSHGAVFGHTCSENTITDNHRLLKPILRKP